MDMPGIVTFTQRSPRRLSTAAMSPFLYSSHRLLVHSPQLIGPEVVGDGAI